MSESKCSYCGESMSTAGHSETTIGGGGVFDGANVKSCPHVPRDRFWVMPNGPLFPETFPDLPGVAKPTLTIKECDRMLKDWSAEMLKDYDKHTMKPGGPVPTPWSGLEAWLPEEGADHRDVYYGPRKSNAQINYEMREKDKAERRDAYWGGQVPKPTYDFTALNEEFCRVELAMRYTAEQRRDGDQVYAPPRMSAEDRAVASAEWSRQLREKVDAAKKRDVEKARETHYWDPEGGEW